MPNSLRHLDVEAHLADPARKQRFVTPMFDIIAPSYDRFTRLFSLGMDAGWKRELLDLMRPHVRSSATALDLACGTGDLAFELARMAPEGEVIGIDASPNMIDAARERLAVTALGSARPPGFIVGDLGHIDRADATVDVVTAGYALRNVPDHRAALGEIARVLRPGGHLVTLDFYRPESRAWRTLFLGYLLAAGNAVGWLWYREPVVYGYIARSIEHFVSSARFAADLGDAGFVVQQVRPKLFGGIAIHVARRR
jgi:demethylmenaquinone methyltransferase/2-methoxy-6-polyprenyl-1,4-benzoquinol methylase